MNTSAAAALSSPPQDELRAAAGGGGRGGRSKAATASKNAQQRYRERQKVRIDAEPACDSSRPAFYLSHTETYSVALLPCPSAAAVSMVLKGTY